MLISYILLNLFDLLLPTDGNKPISLKYLNNHIKVLKWNACGFRPTRTINTTQIKKSRGFSPLDLNRFYNFSLPTLFEKIQINLKFFNYDSFLLFMMAIS